MARSRTTLIHETDGIAVFDFACAARRGECGGDEAIGADQIVLPYHGHFTWRSGTREHVGSPVDGLWCRRGHGYRVAHPVCGGDRCTVVVRRAGSSRRGEDGRDLAAFAADAALHLAHRRLRHTLASAHDTLAKDEAVAAFATRLPCSPSHALPPATRAVTAARELLHATVCEPLDLAAIAAAAGASPHHLARSFHAAVGMPMHRYRLALRVRAALEAVLAGQHDLTALALQLGFCDHAHLTRVFKRHFGSPPSTLRGRP